VKLKYSYGYTQASLPVSPAAERAAWAKIHAVKILFIHPGKPAQKGGIEYINRTYREEVLDEYVSSSLD